MLSRIVMYHVARFLTNLSLYVVHTIGVIKLQFHFCNFTHRHTTCRALLEQKKKDKQNHVAIWVL